MATPRSVTPEPDQQDIVKNGELRKENGETRITPVFNPAFVNEEQVEMKVANHPVSIMIKHHATDRSFISFVISAHPLQKKIARKNEQEVTCTKGNRTIN